MGKRKKRRKSSKAPSAKQRAARAKMKRIANECGIKKGISKKNLFIKMKCCIPKKYGKRVAANCASNAAAEFSRKFG